MPVVDAAQIPDIREQLTRWNRSARTLRMISVLLGFTAIVASVLVASGLLSDGVMRGFAVVAAVATTALTGLDPTRKSNGFRNAWRQLNAQLLRQQSGIEPDERKALGDLIDAYERAEASIGDITVKT